MRTEQKTAWRAGRVDGVFMRCMMALACAVACGTVSAAPTALPTWTEPGTGMVFVNLPKGCFKMGSAKHIGAPADSHWVRLDYNGKLTADEMPQHEACVDAFWMARAEVSEADWHKVMGGTPPADSGQRAKVRVTWLEARQFAQRLTEQSSGKQRFRLPTEAEWEYACRAGNSNDQIMEASDLAGKAWFAQAPTRSYEAREVGVLQANAFGLHDMLGNAWEWTEDSYQSDAYARHTLYNPKVEIAGAPRVIRGGSFRTELAQTRCANRGRYEPSATLDTIGVRLVRER